MAYQHPSKVCKLQHLLDNMTKAPVTFVLHQCLASVNQPERSQSYWVRHQPSCPMHRSCWVCTHTSQQSHPTLCCTLALRTSAHAYLCFCVTTRVSTTERYPNHHKVFTSSDFHPTTHACLPAALKPSTVLSQAVITAGAIISVGLKLPNRHPAFPKASLIDFTIVLALTPILLVGVSAGMHHLLNVGRACMMMQAFTSELTYPEVCCRVIVYGHHPIGAGPDHSSRPTCSKSCPTMHPQAHNQQSINDRSA